jgi:hypothetical protein
MKEKIVKKENPFRLARIACFGVVSKKVDLKKKKAAFGGMPNLKNIMRQRSLR